MLLLAHEFQTLKQIQESGTLSSNDIQPMTARVLYGHRLARKVGSQTMMTLRGVEVLTRGVVKHGRAGDYVQFPETAV